MKVTYRERFFLDNYKCIDMIKTEFFDKMWIVGGLTYFKKGEFTIFSISSDFILEITD